MHLSDIDNGKPFDWGNTSKDYAKYRDVYPAEEVNYKDNTFDVITVCQCIWYLDARIIAGKFAQMLKPGGKLLFYTWDGFLMKMLLQGKVKRLSLSTIQTGLHTEIPFTLFLFLTSCA